VSRLFEGELPFGPGYGKMPVGHGLDHVSLDREDTGEAGERPGSVVHTMTFAAPATIVILNVSEPRKVH